jgi:hypothetical protein
MFTDRIKGSVPMKEGKRNITSKLWATHHDIVLVLWRVEYGGIVSSSYDMYLWGVTLHGPKLASSIL